MSTDIDRRVVLAGATAAAIPTPAVATLPNLEPDPIFAAIEAHRFAWDEYMRPAERRHHGRRLRPGRYRADDHRRRGCPVAVCGRGGRDVRLRWRRYATECERLGIARDISIQRATALMAMANSWQRLAADTGRYDAIVAEKGAPR